MMAITLQTVVSRAAGQYTTDWMDEVIIMHLDNRTYYGLNETGAFIWNHLEQPIQVQTIVEAILTAYEVDPADCEAEVLHLLQDLAQHGLITVEAPV